MRAEARAPGGVEYDTMTHTLRLDAKVPDDRRVTFVLPDDVPVGEAQFVLTVEPTRERPKSVNADLWARMLQQEAAGIITIPPNFGERRVRNPIQAIGGGFVGAVEALIEERDERR